MKQYFRPAAVAAILIGAVYGVLLLAAAAAPAPSGFEKQAASSAVADQLKADATLLSQRTAAQTSEMPSN